MWYDELEIGRRIFNKETREYETIEVHNNTKFIKVDDGVRMIRLHVMPDERISDFVYADEMSPFAWVDHEV